MKIQKIIFITLFFILLSLSVTAQTNDIGCCCDPIAHTGAQRTRNDCLSPTSTHYLPNNAFYPITNLAQLDCDLFCQAPTAQPQQPDLCSNPTARAPVGLTATPIKGDLAIRLEFALQCPTDFVTISRCEGTTCTNFQPIDTIRPQAFYEDRTPGLHWGKEYTYQIIARYNIVGDSTPTTITVSPGDLECWYQTTPDSFCIDHIYYARYENYLKTNGYLQTSAQTFRTSFDATITTLFNGRFKKAFTCDQANKLSSPTIDCTQQSGRTCVVNQGTPACLDTSAACFESSNIFGIFSTVDTCEGTAPTKKYCFLDKSFSLVDTCYPCNSRMQCYDYKSEGTCTRNNCGIGNCAWKPIFEDIGIGVCVDERFNNCPFCNQEGTPTAPNKQAHNTVFDTCTDLKATALSTQQNPCFYTEPQPGQGTAINCDTATCRSFPKTQCAANLVRGVTLNPDNSIATPSNDPCGIRVCHWGGDQSQNGIGCVKNADGTPETQIHWQDCDDEKCERDYFAPETTMIPTGRAGRNDFVIVRINDKINRTSTPVQKQGAANYTTFVCGYRTNGTPCTNFAQTTAAQLNINDQTLKLQDGTRQLASFIEGSNTLRYYSTDPAKNKEIIKQVSFAVCSNCSGPKLLNVTISNARLLNGTYYTANPQPVITIQFNEQANVSTFTLNTSTFIPLTKTPVGYDTDFTIQLTSAQHQLSEGTYTLVINAHDTAGRFMDDPFVAPLVVRTSQATVAITPPDKSVVTTNNVPLVLNFSEPVSLVNISLDEYAFVGEYIKRKLTHEITTQLTSQDQKRYTTTLTNLREGEKTITIQAHDLTGSLVHVQSTFFVNTQGPQFIMTKPRFGIAPSYTFNITIETTTSKGNATTAPVICKWIYDTPTPPPARDFNNFAPFDTLIDNKHTLTNFNRIPQNDNTTHPFHVYCKDPRNNNISQKTFQLAVDTKAPTILTAIAAPNPIKEELFPGTGQYTTTFKTQTDKETFCKYSALTNNFDQMEGTFQGYGETPSTTNIADILVTQQKTHTYFVNCESIAGLKAQPKVISFSIDTSQPFTVRSTTPPTSNSTTFMLSLESSKRALCYYGTNQQTISDCMGTCNFTTIHFQPVTVASSGNSTFYAKCFTGATGNVSPILSIKVLVDTTAPTMLYVNDTGPTPTEPELSPYKDKLLAAFLGKDDETTITQYLFAIQQASTQNFVTPWTPTTKVDGKQVLLPETTTAPLVDKEKYFIHIKPVNIVGLVGEAKISDGITTDFSKTTPGKLPGQSCDRDADCTTNYCTAGKCSQASCIDEERNGLETDIDCGGNCPSCKNDRRCTKDNDCKSKNCHAGMCTDLGPCFDALLTEGIDSETDIDCGGACPQKCDEGKKCKTTTDCASGLFCIQGTCTSSTTGDSDNDGVPDDIDTCPGTPTGARVDQKGCADTQRFSLGDEIPDSWRMEYFICIDCSEAAADADPDGDGYTNIEEFRLGSNPTDANDPGRTSILKILFWILIILILLAGIGAGSYYLYNYYQEHAPKKPVRPQVQRPTPLFYRQPPVQRQTQPTPVRKPLTSEKIEALRKHIKPNEKQSEEGWIPLQQLQKKPLERPTFHDDETLEKLRSTALKSLTPKEREELLKKFKLLKQNKLSDLERQELFRKLRITADYYNAHKASLQKELETWTRKK